MSSLNSSSDSGKKDKRWFLKLLSNQSVNLFRVKSGKPIASQAGKEVGNVVAVREGKDEGQIIVMFQHATNAVKLQICDFEWTENEDCQPFEKCVCDAQRFIEKFNSLLKPRSGNETSPIPSKRPLATAVASSLSKRRKQDEAQGSGTETMDVFYSKLKTEGKMSFGYVDIPVIQMAGATNR
ncbi:uncharacterized protein [Clytia hemisphaerica]|uniref:uncharacterized protein n=1 Tax=Clytia hemisphaerica TaxID=252671 RepID=UPI0034D52AC3